jgi:8-oxo-dGTP diphosphatase
MTEYVAGFMIDELDRVALVIKNRPEWQKGRRNGIGGHIEPGETIEEAMVREFQEETGWASREGQWKKFATLNGEAFRVYFFVSRVSCIPHLKTMTDEEIVATLINSLTVFNCIPNLTWLIPMAKSLEYDRAKHFEITEGY